jgi:ribonuclease HII
MIIYVDEVGMSSIASSLVVCAIAIDKKIEGIKDSKKLSKKKRENFYEIIKENSLYEFGYASPKKIEEMNIYYARYDAMKRAIEKLSNKVKIDKVIVDGNALIPNLGIKQEAVIKADDKFWECGCASILAKVKRDRMMSALSKTYDYDFENNAGYYSPEHKKKMILNGISNIHRKNFLYVKFGEYCNEVYKKIGDYDKYLEYEKQEEEKYNKSFFSIWKDKNKGNWL